MSRRTAEIIVGASLVAFFGGILASVWWVAGWKVALATGTAWAWVVALFLAMGRIADE